MLHDAVSNDVARMDNVFVPGLEVDLVQKAFAAEGQEAATGDGGAAPVVEALTLLDLHL